MSVIDVDMVDVLLITGDSQGPDARAELFTGGMGWTQDPQHTEVGRMDMLRGEIHFP